MYGALTALHRKSVAPRSSITLPVGGATCDDIIGTTATYCDTESSRSFEAAPLLSNLTWSPTASEHSTDSSSGSQEQNTIRFQVVLWHVDHLDVVNQQIAATFRVTIFWNDDSDQIDGTSVRGSSKSNGTAVWQMHGLQKAFLHEYPHPPLQAIDVPPVSILNVTNFSTIGSPEVSMLRESEKLMRWTCMYRATLIQDHWRVDEFPHDEHDITLKIGILSHRGPGGQWDRNKWKLGLATTADTDGFTKVPHGLVVDHVSIPEFKHSKWDGMSFGLAPLNHGHPDDCHDQCLVVKLRVWRDSSYYDKNIIPLLAVIHFVSTSMLCLESELFFYRGLLTLNMAFVGMGLRISTDRNLPSSSYQIKLQRIFNEYFFGTLALVLESLAVYLLQKHGFEYLTAYINSTAGILALTQNLSILLAYYAAAKKLNTKARRNPLKEL